MSDEDGQDGDADTEKVAVDVDPDELADPDAFTERLDEAADALDAAATEDDLDAVEEQLDAITDDLAAATFESDLTDGEEDEEDEAADDEDAVDHREELESRLDALREDLEDARGPYAADVIDDVESVSGTIEETRWTPTGVEELQPVVEEFVETVTDVDAIDAAIEAPGDAATDDVSPYTEPLDAAAEAVGDAGLDPDADAETIATLLDAIETLDAGVDAAETWDDLTVRETLEMEGFYDALDHRKDFPPEWAALKVWEQRGRTDMILLAHEELDSEFMEGHCLDALKRLGDPAAVDTVLPLANRRDRDAIEVLGKVGPEAGEAVTETLVDFLDADGDPGLQRVTLRALGEIGDPAATQPVANLLVSENDAIRSAAARSLGLLGDPRAIDPLTDVLTADDVDSVRGSAAWALRAIGTERALDALADHGDDPSYLVRTEATKVA